MTCTKRYTDQVYIYSKLIHIRFLADLRYLKVIPPSLPSFLTDQYAREVVVCCEGAVSYLAWLLAGLFIYLLACLLTCLPGWLVDWLLAYLLAWLIGWLVSWLVVCLLCWLVCLLACSFARSLAFLLAFLVCFACLPILICFAWLTCKACAVQHQKLNQRRRFGWVLVFNLLALVCFELARLTLFLGLLAYLTLVWFVGLEGLFCFWFRLRLVFLFFWAWFFEKKRFPGFGWLTSFARSFACSWFCVTFELFFAKRHFFLFFIGGFWAFFFWEKMHLPRKNSRIALILSDF